MNKKALRFILITFLIWQFFIGLFIFLGEKYIPSSHQYLYTEALPHLNPKFLWNRANFDGMHYLSIARKGYGIYQQAFFPLYPWLIRFLTPYFGGRDLMASLAISWVSHFLALYFLYKLVILDFNKNIAKKTIFYLLIFPASFFFSMVYSESLFLFLVLASFYFARTQKWWLAGICGGLTSATRLVGIFLWPALLVEYLRPNNIKYQIEEFLRNANIKNTYQKLKRKNNFEFLISHSAEILYRLLHFTFCIFNLLSMLIIPLGLILYMRYLAAHYHDPLMFLHVQPYFGAERTGKLILLYQVFWRYLKMLWMVQKNSLTYFVVVLEFLTGAGFLGLLIWSYLEKIRLSYLLFAGLAYIAPTLTGTFSSLPRYVLILFPCFITLALIKNKILRFAFFVFSFSLLIICVILFSQGYWIS